MHPFILSVVVNAAVVHSLRMFARSSLHLDSNEPRPAESFIEYGFRSIPDGPCMLTETRPLFDLPSEAIDIVHSPYLYTKYLTADSVNETAEKFSREAGIDASYGAFSASAQASIEELSLNNVKTLRVDAMMRAEKFRVTLLPLHPHRYLKEEIKTLLLKAPPAEIVSKLGEFYADKLILGGVFQSTHVKDSFETDSTKSFEAEVKSNLDFLLGSATGSAATDMTESQLSLRKQVTTTYRVKGGDVSIWLRLGPDNANTVQDEWGRSVRADNLFPVKHHLQPLWHLLEHPEMNHSKGSAIKEYLTQKWDLESRSIPHPSYPTVAPSPTPSGPCAGLWEMCGGKDWSGATCCQEGLECKYDDEWYSGCSPAASLDQVTLHRYRGRNDGFLK
jgi:hypothetical protein